MPRLSILVPLSGPIEPFETTLASVLQNRPVDCEVLVAHPESYDDPWSLAGEVQFLEAPTDTPLLEMLDACLPYVNSPILHVIQGGVEVTEGWADAALAEFRRPQVATVSPLMLDASRSRITARGVAYRRGGTRVVAGAGQAINDDRRQSSPVLGPTLNAGFYRTEILRQLGGWETSISPSQADIDLALSLSAAKLTCVVCERSVVVGDLPPSPVTGLTEARSAERVFWRHLVHQGWLPSLLAHPFTVASQAIGALPSPRALTQLIGRALTITEKAQFRQFREELATWCATAPQRLAAAADSGEEPAVEAPTRSLPRRQAA